MVLAMFTWALAAIAAKVLSNYISENEIVVYRYFLAAASMVPILLFMGLSFKIDWKNLALALLIALFTIANVRFYFMGIDLGTAGLGAALVTVLIPMPSGHWMSTPGGKAGSFIAAVFGMSPP